MEVKTVKDEIVKSEPVKWRDLLVLQPKGFKELEKEDRERIKQSLLSKGFIDPFMIWQDKKGMYIIDGVHRRSVMLEMEELGEAKFADAYTANFIKCKNRKDAAEKILIYSSYYARILKDGLKEMIKIEGLEIPEIAGFVNIPEVDMVKFGDWYIADQARQETGAEKEPHGLGNPISSYNIIFDSEEQLKTWYEFISWLRKRDASQETIAYKITQFIKEVQGVQTEEIH